MDDIPLTKKQERYDIVPQSLRDALNSETIDELLWIIGEAHHLGEERTFKLVKIYGLIALGFIHPQDLQKEIVSELHIDKRLAEEIAHELQIKILNPLLPEINAAFNYHIAGIPTPSSSVTTLSSVLQPEIMRPSFAPREQELGVNQDRPFILHEEQKETGSVRPVDETLVRPSFYEEAGGRRQEAGIERPLAARLEIGDAEGWAAKEPQASKTRKESIRVVHYSGPQTPVDPFNPETRDQRQETRTPEPPQPPQDIHPENIVDLKDLPK